MKFTTPLLCLALLLPLGLQAEADTTPPDIVDTAVKAGSFKTLVAAAQAAGLVDALKAEGPLTVFAPTDAAFAALPDGTVASLLEPANRATLKRILTFHVVAGRVLSSDLLPVKEAATLAGAHLPLGLRVGQANVVQADILCSNGVIHVIDAVLMPPKAKNPEKMMPARQSAIDVEDAILRAIDLGVPVFNEGNPAGCAAIYRKAAEMLVHEGGDSLSDLARHDLTQALGTHNADASEEAWTLRRAFDRILSDLAFEPRMEASLPKGFPKAGPVGKVVNKRYPVYRAARAQGGQAFWTLFQHIKKNKVEMTAPVEMTMGDGMRMKDMAFLYEHPEQGRSGEQGRVAVLDLEPVDVLSIGMRGRRNDDLIATAKKLIEARMQADGIKPAGDWRVLGYNSPMVPAERQFWELQVPIAR